MLKRGEAISSAWTAACGPSFLSNGLASTPHTLTPFRTIRKQDALPIAPAAPVTTARIISLRALLATQGGDDDSVTQESQAEGYGRRSGCSSAEIDGAAFGRAGGGSAAAHASDTLACYTVACIQVPCVYSRLPSPCNNMVQAMVKDKYVQGTHFVA